MSHLDASHRAREEGTQDDLPIGAVVASLYESKQETDEEGKREMTRNKTTGESVNLRALSDLCTPWCVHVVATLRIADLIAAGTTDIKTLAEEAGCDIDSLLRVLRHLVGKGVFQEPAPGRFALNEAAMGLLDSSLRLGFDLNGIGGRMATAWGTLLTAVRTGVPPTTSCSASLLGGPGCPSGHRGEL